MHIPITAYLRDAVSSINIDITQSLFLLIAVRSKMRTSPVEEDKEVQPLFYCKLLLDVKLVDYIF